MSPAPFRADAETLLASGSIRHETTVTAVTSSGTVYPIPVEEGSLSITFAEDWSPYAQVDLTAAVPAVAVMDALDPRMNVRLKIDAGYTYPDNVTEVFPFANLGLIDRGIRRPSNLMGLEAASDEAGAQDYRLMVAEAVPKTGINEAASWMIGKPAVSGVPVIVSDFAAASFAADLTTLELGVGDQVWKGLDDVAARTGKRIYCDELRTWRITSRPAAVGTPAYSLTVGETGTLLDTEAGLGREDWFNAVAIRHRWTPVGGAQTTIVGTATTTSGPFAVAAVGRKVYFEESDVPITQAQADKKALTRLGNLITRGRSLKLQAIAAYWLRPGMTINVQLPTGPPELHLIRSITFEPLVGTMTIITRQPTTATIRTGE